MQDILTYGDDRLLKELKRAEKPAYVCTIASSDTGAIEGISIAGASAEMRRYTPPADMEALFYGEAKCIPGVAATPGRSLVTGNAVEDVEGLFERGQHLGHHLAKLADYLVLGESVPAGTTTALAVMLALGMDAEDKVSSSMIGGAHALKYSTVLQGFGAAGIGKGTLARDPLEAVRCVGDPMQDAVAGIATAASRSIPVMLAGGTQMAAVAAVIDRLGQADMGNICIGTTRWVREDADADLVGLAEQAGCPRVYAADLDFGESRFQGLHPDEAGLVKEGVGAGGMAVAALVRTEITAAELVASVEDVYEATVVPMLKS